MSKSFEKQRLWGHLACSVVLLCAAGLLVPPAVLAAETDSAERRIPLGPLASHNLHPLYAPFLQLSPLPARTVGENTVATFIVASYGNNYFYDPLNGEHEDLRVILDSEAAYTNVGITWGVHPRAEVNASLQTVAHFGGVFDPGIESYHRLLGLPNAGRHERPANHLRFYFETAEEVILDERAPVVDITALLLEPRVQLYGAEAESPAALSLAAAVKLPLASPSVVLTSGGADIAVRLMGAYTWPRLALTAGVGAAYLSRPEYIPEDAFTPWVAPFHFSAEWMATEQFSFLTAVNGTTSPFELGYRRSDRFSAIALFGGGLAVNRRLTLRAAMGQEFFTFAATDVGLHVSLRYRFAERWEPRR